MTGIGAIPRPGGGQGLPNIAADLAAMLADVLSTVLGQEALPTSEPMGDDGPVALARLAIHDEATGQYAGVEVQVGTGLARVLASRMMLMADPSDDDVIDAVAELGNITAGSTKSLLFKHARLSLPSSEIVPAETVAAAERAERQQVRAIVLGHVVQLSVVPDFDPEGLLWPPVVSDELLGRL